jgi:hypothetical protein
VNTISSKGNINSPANSEMRYVLPLEIDQISNYQDILSTFQLSDAAKSMLLTNGFVVIRHPVEQYKSVRIYPSTIPEFYKKVRASETTHDRMLIDIKEWEEYHRQYREARKDWPIVPYEEIIKRIIFSHSS